MGKTSSSAGFMRTEGCLVLTAGRHIETAERVLPLPLKVPLKSLVKGYRQLTAAWRVLPDFLVIGARKCGSTSIYRYLVEHPLVLPALKKEIFYFTLNYERGERWYRGHFPTRFEKALCAWWTGGEPLVGEATPNYITCRETPERVRRMNPQIKLIVVLRDPVEAAYSAYQFGILRGIYTEKSLPFRGLIERELALLSNGQPPEDPDGRLLLPRYAYADQLSLWYETFPRDQVHVVCLESFADSPQAHYDELVGYLGLPPHRLGSFEVHNGNHYRPMEPDLQERLRAFYRPYKQRLHECTGLSVPWAD